MTLRHMRIFVAVCQCGSVTAAAQKLHIAQPAASLAISELEDYYGVCLFDRIARRLHITQAGKHFLQYATHIVSLFDQLDQEVRDWDHMGVLRVGASITIGNYLLPHYVSRFQRSYPKIQLRVVIDNTQKVAEAVLKNDLDLGLVEGAVQNPYLITQPFMEDPLVFICAPQHPWAQRNQVAPGELTQVPFLLREQGSGGRTLLDSALESQGIHLEPAWQSVSTQAIVRAVRLNLGVSALPWLLVRENLERGEVVQVRVAGLNLARPFSVICHQNKFLTGSAQAFMALCLAKAPLDP